MHKICKEYGCAKFVAYSSIVQVFLREAIDCPFFFVEIPFLSPGIKYFEGMYLPYGSILDDMVIFMRDGVFTEFYTQQNAKVPVIPVDFACELLIKGVIEPQAMRDTLYIGDLDWERFFYLLSDHFNIHSYKNAFSGSEIKIKTNKPQFKVRNFVI